MNTKVEKVNSGKPIEKPANGKSPIGPSLKTYPEKPANCSNEK